MQTQWPVTTSHEPPDRQSLIAVQRHSPPRHRKSDGQLEPPQLHTVDPSESMHFSPTPHTVLPHVQSETALSQVPGWPSLQPASSWQPHWNVVLLQSKPMPSSPHLWPHEPQFPFVFRASQVFGSPLHSAKPAGHPEPPEPPEPPWPPAAELWLLPPAPSLALADEVDVDAPPAAAALGPAMAKSS